MKSYNPFNIKMLLWTSLILEAILGLCACSNNGSGRNPLPPSLRLEFRQVNIFHFTWSDIEGESGYRLLEDPDSLSGYSVVATAGPNTTSLDLYVSLPDRINASYMLQALRNGYYDSMGEVYVTGSLADAVGYFKASNTEEGDAFGVSVALSGDGLTLAIGAPYEDSGATGPKHPGELDYVFSQQDNSMPDSGAVYVFAYTDDGWEQQAYIKAWNGESLDQFGSAVDLSYDGNTLAVGAPYEDSGATGPKHPGEPDYVSSQEDNSMPDSGAIYVFIRSAETWYPDAYIKASNPEEEDLFGFSLALSGDGETLAAGAPLEDSDGSQGNNNRIDSGAVYVFALNVDSWYQQAYLKLPSIDPDDQFGFSLALSDNGNVLAVGNPLNDSAGTNPADNSAQDSGAVVIFRRNALAWSTQDFIKASNAEGYDYFGVSIAISGDGSSLAVGATGEDGNGFNEGNNSIADSGAVYVFEGSVITWTQTDYLKAPNTGAGDEFGGSVAISGDGYSIAVGADLEDSREVGINGDSSDNSAPDSGAVYLFFRPADIFSPFSYIKASNTEEYDRLGYSVDLSWDGFTLAAGAPVEDSGATGIAGDASDNSATDSGAVYFY